MCPLSLSDLRTTCPYKINLVTMFISVIQTVVLFIDFSQPIQLHCDLIDVAKVNEHMNALRGTSRFGFAGVPNAPNIELGLLKHKERARVSPLRFSWALIEQRKRNKPPLRNRFGSFAAIDLFLARCARCSAVLGAV